MEFSAADPTAIALMERVGARVRRARELKGISRRVLSETSGVSPRYLAQLETGTGNISIARLAHVAEALDHKIEWFLSEQDPVTSDAHQVAELYRIAPDAVKGHVRQILMRSDKVDRAQRVCLIGLRGAGKSTLGRMAARSLDVPFVELNAEIEAQTGMPISEVMALYGGDGYRELEAQALQRVIAEHNRLILAVAGGVVSNTDVYELLLSRFFTVWLRAAPSDHMDRVRAQGDLRPMQGHPEAMAHLRSILAEREGEYRRAIASLDTSGRSLEGARGALVRLIEEREFLSST